MAVHPSGYYAWRAKPDSPRAKSDRHLLGLIKHFWLESGGVYGYRKITDDLRDEGETCGKHRVYRLMRAEGLRSQTGYRRRQGHYGKPAVVAPNRLAQQFDSQAPNQVWVADITYIPTDEGWLYLAAIKDLYSCEIVGWAMDSRMTKALVADALRAAYWRKKPKPGLMHHSDRGSQYCSATYRALQASYGMRTSMSRKGNCWDNAPMESFFGTLKTESLHHYRFVTREQTRQVVFEYIEVFYNRIRRHAKISNQVPADFANQFYASRQ